MRHLTYVIFTWVILFVLAGCRKEEVVYLQEDDPVGAPATEPADYAGFYILNEGNMGMNACTLDYYSYTTGVYSRNIYGTANPTVAMELGDVGNDLELYRGRLYAVINCSNKVEVMEAATARRVGQVEIPNCRYIVFDGDYGYVTSYAGPVEIGPEHAQLGYVAKVDLASLQVVDRCLVRYQPDGIALVGRKLYVANSGGYMVPNYESTLSVIDLETFNVSGSIEIAPNLQYVIADSHNALWVSARGDYYGNASALYRYSLTEEKVTHCFAMPVGTLWLSGDSLLVAGSEFSYDTFEDVKGYNVVDVATCSQLPEPFACEKVRREVVVPYGVARNPRTGDILLTDAGNYVNPGYVYCLAPDGTVRWKHRGGDIPAHFCLMPSEINE